MSRFYYHPRKRTSGVIWIGGCVGSSVRQLALDKSTSCPCQGAEYDLSTVHPVVSHAPQFVL